MKNPYNVKWYVDDRTPELYAIVNANGETLCIVPRGRPDSRDIALLVSRSPELLMAANSLADASSKLTHHKMTRAFRSWFMGRIEDVRATFALCRGAVEG